MPGQVATGGFETILRRCRVDYRDQVVARLGGRLICDLGPALWMAVPTTTGGVFRTAVSTRVHMHRVNGVSRSSAR